MFSHLYIVAKNLLSQKYTTQSCISESKKVGESLMGVRVWRDKRDHFKCFAAQKTMVDHDASNISTYYRRVWILSAHTKKWVSASDDGYTNYSGLITTHY